MPQNEELIRSRKDNRLSQKDLGLKLAQQLNVVLTDKYAQRKISLWENMQARPSEQEIEALAHVLERSKEVVANFFAGRTLPNDASTVIGSLVAAGSPSLIATCAGLQTRPEMLREVEVELIAALRTNMSLAIFFPYPTSVAGTTESTFILGVAGVYVNAWTTLMNFYQRLRARAGTEAGAADRLALYRPKRTMDAMANVLVPPIQRRWTMTYSYEKSEIRRNVYVWTQSDDLDQFYIVDKGSPDMIDEPTFGYHLNALEWYFGETIPHWKKYGAPGPGDSYWSRLD